MTNFSLLRSLPHSLTHFVRFTAKLRRTFTLKIRCIDCWFNNPWERLLLAFLLSLSAYGVAGKSIDDSAFQILNFDTSFFHHPFWIAYEMFNNNDENSFHIWEKLCLIQYEAHSTFSSKASKSSRWSVTIFQLSDFVDPFHGAELRIRRKNSFSSPHRKYSEGKQIANLKFSSSFLVHSFPRFTLIVNFIDIHTLAARTRVHHLSLRLVCRFLVSHHSSL